MITIGIAKALMPNTKAANHLQNMYEEVGAKVEVILHPCNEFYYKNKRVGFRKYYQILKDNYTDILIVMLTKEGVLSGEYNKIPIDVVIVPSDMAIKSKRNDLRLYEHRIIDVLKQQSYGIIPVGFENKKELSNHKGQLITYGMGRKAMIGASSIEVDVEGYHLLQCCIKSAIETFQGRTIHEQEFAIKVAEEDVDMTLAGIATLLLYGIDCPNMLKQYQR